MNQSVNPHTWRGMPDPVRHAVTWRHAPRLAWRLVAVLLNTLLLLVPYVLLRLVDLMVPSRQISPYIARIWARVNLEIIGLRLVCRGKLATKAQVFVANHSSWLDIWALQAVLPGYFVAKSEVRSWPLIGFLARLSGAEFIQRNRRHSAKHSNRLRERLELGHALCFFPEGTSTDGLRVLPFKSTLFAAVFEYGQHTNLQVQPVSVRYQADPSLPPHFYALWGGMSLFHHLISVLSHSRHGKLEIVLHKPVQAQNFIDRKELSLYCEHTVRNGLEQS